MPAPRRSTREGRVTVGGAAQERPSVRVNRVKAQQMGYVIKKTGLPPRVCPECGRKFPEPKSGKPQAHRYPAPNQWMNCPGVPE